MVDDVFRSHRNHDTVDPEGSEQTARGGIGDPLAELARLTGQPYGDGAVTAGRLGGGRHLSRAASAGRGALSCPLASPTIPYGATPTIPCGATAPEAEEAAVHQTFFPPRSQIQMASLRTPVTIRQRFVRFNTHAQGSRLHPAEMISSRFCRAPEPRRSCPLCRMAGTLARCGRLRLTKLSAPIAFTMLARARAGGSLW